MNSVGGSDMPGSSGGDPKKNLKYSGDMPPQLFQFLFASARLSQSGNSRDQRGWNLAWGNQNVEKFQNYPMKNQAIHSISSINFGRRVAMYYP